MKKMDGIIFILEICKLIRIQDILDNIKVSDLIYYCSDGVGINNGSHIMMVSEIIYDGKLDPIDIKVIESTDWTNYGYTRKSKNLNDKINKNWYVVRLRRGL